jgi:hypothetical protein
MHEHKLYLWSEKCKFEQTRIEYLGVIISHNKVEMDLVKIAGVADWPTPSNNKEVQSFVGFVNFCKGTSVRFLTSPILSHSPPVHMYLPSSPLYYSQGL